MITLQDKEFLAQKGISEEQIAEQLACFEKGFPYLWYGKQHYYYPDFVLEDGTFVEIKGVKLGKDARKISKFPYKLIVLYYDDIKPYMMYLKTKYGSDPTKIYDKYIYDSFTR